MKRVNSKEEYVERLMRVIKKPNPIISMRVRLGRLKGSKDGLKLAE